MSNINNIDYISMIVRLNHQLSELPVEESHKCVVEKVRRTGQILFDKTICEMPYDDVHRNDTLVDVYTEFQVLMQICDIKDAEYRSHVIAEDDDSKEAL